MSWRKLYKSSCYLHAYYSYHFTYLVPLNPHQSPTFQAQIILYAKFVWYSKLRLCLRMCSSMHPDKDSISCIHGMYGQCDGMGNNVDLFNNGQHDVVVNCSDYCLKIINRYCFIVVNCYTVKYSGYCFIMEMFRALCFVARFVFLFIYDVNLSNTL